MPILGERFYQISNAIFCYDLKPIPLAVYSYLVCCAGQKELCWPSIKTIALQLFGKRCEGRSQAISGSRIHPQGGRWRQSNNHYYILPLPALSTAGHRASRKSTTGDVVEEVYQQNKG